VSESRPIVAFDVTAAINGRTGIARYVTQLGVALERRGTSLRRFAIGRAGFAPPARTRWLPVPARLLRRWWRIAPWPPAELLTGAVDVVHATGLLVPPTRRPLVITVHDLAAIRHPELHPPRHRELVLEVVSMLPRAAAILAVSRATADDLLRLGADPRRVLVSPLGLTPLPPPAAPPPGAPAAGTYLLTVGETSPRKDHALVLRALAQLDPALSLVMAGPPASAEPRLRRLIDELGLASRVVRLQRVGDAELSALYAGALALCFPSVAEGFGLPLVEAMAAGVPVIASDIAVTRELTAGAALLVDGSDVRGWVEAIRTLVSDDHARRELAGAGTARAREFRWEDTAAATEEAYRLALGRVTMAPARRAGAGAHPPRGRSAPS
jgi:glycosyltransferase involved in cell wall biosynthesis